MKLLREIHDFVAGGSIVAPIGVACALVLGIVTVGIDPGARATIVLTVTVLTFVGSTLERSA